MENNADVDRFLKLPDWKKISYKVSHPKFDNYPIQTKEQETHRIEMLYAICAHFAMLNYDAFLESLTNPIRDVWPNAMELFVTPTLLDFVELKTLVEYGYCPFCEYYDGYRVQPRMWSRIAKSKIIPVYGRCTVIEKDTQNFEIIKNMLYVNNISDHVSSHQRCYCWNPISMIEGIIDLKIKKLIASNKFPYYYSDYRNDLHYLNLWDFLQNRYRLNRT